MITWSLKNENLLFLNRSIRVWSKVRNELNGQRPRNGAGDVVYTTNADGSDGVPYMPRPFPIGNWNITGIVPHLTKADEIKGYLYPYYISTDAWQMVDEWDLDQKGRYLKPSGRKVKDYAYGLHWPEFSQTTLGCGRFDTKDHLLSVVAELTEMLNHAKTIPLQVIE